MAEMYGSYPGIFKSINLKDILSDEDYENIFLQGKPSDKTVVTNVNINDTNCIENNTNWDNLVFKTTSDDGWRKYPSNLPLAADEYIHVVQGNMHPNKLYYSIPSNTIGPSLDGTDKTPNKLFMFANNLSSPACCPSTYTTSNGCICTSDNQRDFIMSRGLPSFT